MSSPSSEDLTFGPRTTSLSSASPPEHECLCHPMGNLERLPLLHAVLDRAAGSFIGRAFTLIFQIAISLSVILLPTIILQKTVTILECIDCIGFLLICCIEVILPSLNRLIWGDVGHIPQACCDRSRAMIAPRRRSSFGMVMVYVVAGFDIRLILVSVTRFISRSNPACPATSVHFQIEKMVSARCREEAVNRASSGE
jgi:hypothetical protein